MAQSSDFPYPSFVNPPVSEVVLGVTFDRLLDFKSPYVGLLWQKYLSDFPHCDHANPLGLPSAFVEINEMPFPRVWFISDDSSALIQIQNDRFLFNWRKINETDNYPRYSKVKNQFKTNFNKFKKFVKDYSLGEVNIIASEITYINHIPMSQGWKSMKDIGKIFPDLKWRSYNERFLPPPDVVNWNAGFSLPDNCGRLTAKINRATRRSDDIEVLILELTAKSVIIGGKLKSSLDWMDIAREWIVKGFADLTSTKIQDIYWNRE